MHHTSIMLQQRRQSMFPKRSLIFTYITTILAKQRTRAFRRVSHMMDHVENLHLSKLLADQMAIWLIPFILLCGVLDSLHS
jgi:hypothetical protein